MAKLTKRTSNEVNKCLRELDILRDIIVQTYEDDDIDWLTLQVDNAKFSLYNLLGKGSK